MNSQSSSAESKSSSNATSFSRTLRQALPALLLVPSVALILSAFMAWANVGFGDEFLARWGKGFITSVVVLPMILACLGVLERGVDALFASMHRVGRKLLVSLLAAFIIESVLAVAVSLINNPWDSSFGHAWWMAFSRSLPAGILIGLFMAFYMKPKMDQMMKAAKLAPA